MVTSPNSGTEVVAYLRIFGCIPFGILIVIIYSWFQSTLTKPTIVIIMYGTFILFYLAYAFYIIPNHKLFSINPEKIAQLMLNYPHIKWIFPAYGNWTISLFFVFSEVWIIVSVTQFFWQSANHYTKTEQAARIYPLFIIFAGIANVLFAFFLDRLINLSYDLGFPSSTAALASTMQIVTVINIFLSIVIIIFFKKLHHHVSLMNISAIKNEIRESKHSVFEGFKFLFESSYLLYIFISLVASGIIYRLINSLWKSELRLFTHTSSIFNELLTHYSLWTGVGLVVFAIVTKNLIQRFGWFSVVLMTPVLSLLSAIPFFLLLFFHHLTGDFTALFEMNPHRLLSAVGSFQSIAMTASIACLYNPTKEMSYLPLDRERKTKGKIATDVLGSTCGTAGSGIIQAGLLTWTAGIDLSFVPHILIILIFLFGVWFYASFALSKKYFLLISSQKK